MNTQRNKNVDDDVNKKRRLWNDYIENNLICMYGINCPSKHCTHIHECLYCKSECPHQRKCILKHNH